MMLKRTLTLYGGEAARLNLLLRTAKAERENLIANYLRLGAEEGGAGLRMSPEMYEEARLLAEEAMFIDSLIWRMSQNGEGGHAEC